MSKKVFHLMVELAGDVRAYLLRVYPPRFPDVHCRRITLAYGQGRYMDGVGVERSVTIYGRHDGIDTDALLVDVDGDMFQPRREAEPFKRPYHITLSCAPGIPPQRAGIIDPSRTKLFETGHDIPGLRAVLRRARVDRPQRLDAVA